MAEAAVNPINQYISAQLFGPKTQADLMAAQQQQALSQALLQQGETPIDTNNRMVGNIGYQISPWEGVAKLAQALSGNIGQKQANKAYVDALTGGSGAAPASSGMTAKSLNASLGLPEDTPPLATMEILNGNRAISEFLKPTEQQKNFGPQMDQWRNNQLNSGFLAANPGIAKMLEQLGTYAAQNAPVGASPTGVSGYPAINPVQAQPLPVIGNPSKNYNDIPPVNASDLQPSNNAQALADYRNANNMTAPPIDAQRSSLGLPVGESSNLPLPSAQQPKSSKTAPPSSIGRTNAEHQADIAIWQKGQEKQAEESAKNISDAQKAADTIDSRFDNSQAILSQMKALAPKTSGGPSAGIMDSIHRALNDSTSASNKSFENLASNQLTTALAPIVQGVGGRIDIPLMNAIQEAESVQLSDSTKGKIAAIDNLSKMLEAQRQNAHNQVANLSGQPMPQQTSPFSEQDLIKSAKLAPDGKYYAPDPSRPGKYLMVTDAPNSGR